MSVCPYAIKTDFFFSDYQKLFSLSFVLFLLFSVQTYIHFISMFRRTIFGENFCFLFFCHAFHFIFCLETMQLESNIQLEFRQTGFTCLFYFISNMSYANLPQLNLQSNEMLLNLMVFFSFLVLSSKTFYAYYI